MKKAPGAVALLCLLLLCCGFARADTVEAVTRAVPWCRAALWIEELRDTDYLDRSSMLTRLAELQARGLCGVIPVGTRVKMLDPGRALQPVQGVFRGSPGMVWL